MTPARVRALVTLLVASGDLTPTGARVILAAVAEEEADTGVGNE